MIARWFASKLFGPIASALVILFAGAFAFQTVRIDGFPLFWTGLRTQLAECRGAQGKANEAVIEAINKGREEGRIAAIADGKALREAEAERETRFGERMKQLDELAKGLQRPRPPQRVTVDAPLPVVVTPPVGPSCALDRDGLAALRTFLNAGRGP